MRRFKGTEILMERMMRRIFIRRISPDALPITTIALFSGLFIIIKVPHPKPPPLPHPPHACLSAPAPQCSTRTATAVGLCPGPHIRCQKSYPHQTGRILLLRVRVVFTFQEIRVGFVFRILNFHFWQTDSTSNDDARSGGQ